MNGAIINTVRHGYAKWLKRKKTIIWMSAWKGYTQATIYFPDKYIDEILNLNVSDDTKK